MRIQFIGATRQVTGSQYYFEAAGRRMLVDCGLYQERSMLPRNWEPSPIPPSSLDYILLTHAHVDHCGLIPRWVKNGFRGTILTTEASKELAEIVLLDAGRIQEEDAEFKQRRHAREGRKGPHPILPLYTAADVQDALPLFKAVRYGETTALGDGLTVTYHDAGHILGSAMLELAVQENGEERTVIFSGDIGEVGKPIIRDPTFFDKADYVVMESTYGDRNHPNVGPVEDQLCDVINDTVDKGGNIIIPTFAVERAQELMFYLGRLIRANRIPHLLVFLDSPMAVDVTQVFRRHRDCMDEEARRMLEAGEPPCRFPGLQLVREADDSKAINRIKGSCIIMAGSGMCTAGRVKHHLVKNVSRPESTILFVGYQAVSTLGRQLVEGNKTVRIHGTQYKVKARVAQVHGMSAHADQAALLNWIGHLKDAPRCVFITHGEEDASKTLAGLISASHGWRTHVPNHREEMPLD